MMILMNKKIKIKFAELLDICNEIKKFKKVLTSKRLSDKIIFADAVKKQQSGSRENNRFCAER